MQNIGQLTGTAAKLLLHLLVNPGGERGATAQMRAIGTTNKGSYYAARRQLTEMGCVDSDGNCTITGTFFNPRVLENVPGGTKNTTSVLENVPTLVTENVPGVLENVPGGTNNGTGTLWATLSSPVDRERGLLTRIAEADRLPYTARDNQPTSEFVRRRKVQVPLLQEAFKMLLDFDASESAATKLLQVAGDCAEAVYEAIQTAASRGKKIEYPIGYVRSILQASPTTPTLVGNVGAAKETDGDEPGQGGFNGIVYRERTAEEREWSRRKKEELIRTGRAYADEFED